MIPFKNIMITGSLVAALALSGCSSGKPAEQATPDSKPKPVITESKQTETKTTENKNAVSIAQGAQNMRDALKQMKEDLNNNNEEEAVKTSENLEENWSSFEDSVKGKSPTLYENVEDPLGKIQAGVKIKPLDTKTITAAMNELDQVLAQVQQIK